MFPELHDVLRDLIYDKGRIERNDVDVTFEVPTKEWADKLVRPTLNLHLFELIENTDLRQAQFQTARNNGQAQVRAAPRRIDLRYVVSAFTTNSEDALRLLWHVLAVLMRTPEIDASLFKTDAVLEAPVVTRVAQPDSGVKLLDVWSALSNEPRPAFCYVVTLPVDLQLEFQYDFVLGRTYTYRNGRRNANSVVDTRSFVRGTVRDPAGKPLPDVLVSSLEEPRASARTDPSGAFTLRTRSSGKIAIRMSNTRGRTTDALLDLDSRTSGFDLVLD
jgi:uncharacterized protein DUF4255